MDLAVVQRLALTLRELGTREVMLSGGEPLLHPDWPEIARLLRDAGCRVVIVTNGLLLARYEQPLVELCDALVVSPSQATPVDDTFDLLTRLNAPDARAQRRAIRGGERPECRRCVCPLYRSPVQVVLGHR
jgi:molybdenum cofactor biosynthesis enzyme MoaA